MLFYNSTFITGISRADRRDLMTDVARVYVRLRYRYARLRRSAGGGRAVMDSNRYVNNKLMYIFIAVRVQ